MSQIESRGRHEPNLSERTALKHETRIGPTGPIGLGSAIVGLLARGNEGGEEVRVVTARLEFGRHPMGAQPQKVGAQREAAPSEHFGKRGLMAHESATLLGPYGIGGVHGADAMLVARQQHPALLEHLANGSRHHPSRHVRVRVHAACPRPLVGADPRTAHVVPWIHASSREHDGLGHERHRRRAAQHERLAWVPHEHHGGGEPRNGWSLLRRAKGLVHANRPRPHGHFEHLP